MEFSIVDIDNDCEKDQISQQISENTNSKIDIQTKNNKIQESKK